MKNLKRDLDKMQKLALSISMQCLDIVRYSNVFDGNFRNDPHKAEAYDFINELRDISYSLKCGLDYSISPICLPEVVNRLARDISDLARNLPCPKNIYITDKVVEYFSAILKIQEWLDFAGEKLYKLPQVTAKPRAKNLIGIYGN